MVRCPDGLTEIISRIRNPQGADNVEIENTTKIEQQLYGLKTKSKMKIFFQVLFEVATGISANLIMALAH